jgi:hypothetical protein
MSTVLFCLGELLFLAGIAYASFRLGWERGHERGYVLGEQAGRDREWIDQFIARGREEQRKHDRYGRFRVKSLYEN